MRIAILCLFITISCPLPSQNINTLIVNPQHPIAVNDTLLRNSLVKWSESFVNTGNELFETHSSAVTFPGLPMRGYKLISGKYKLVHKQSSKKDSLLASKFIFAQPYNVTAYNTGFYAPPGTKIGITLPANWDNEEVWVGISAHNDVLFDVQEPWRRMPCVFSQIKLSKEIKFVSSPFGGIIYIMVKPYTKSVNTEITFTNVISSPYFELGKTKIDEWKKQLSNNKAPWGEIASDKLIITLPDSVLQTITNPASVMQTWNKIISAEYELAQLPTPFIRPMRFVVDEHMAAGFMHSGYPIMIHHSPTEQMLSLDIIANPEKLLSDDDNAKWGFFHEIGHNLQNWEWVFDGSTEVGCNFYTLYVFDKVIGNRRGGNENISKEHQDELMKKYFSDGAKYEDYQKEPFLGLIPFMQVQKEFGWDPFKRVFKLYIDHPTESLSYNNDPPEIWKEKNIMKIDLLVTRFSLVLNKNMAPFFTAWGLPVSNKTQLELNKYPTWISKDLEPYLKLKSPK